MVDAVTPKQPDPVLVDLLAHPMGCSVESFLAAWHGPPMNQVTALEGGDLPLAVRRLRSVLTGWPGAFCQNHLTDFVPEGRPDLRVFYLENQAVFSWATDGRGDDPVVLGRWGYDDERWLAEPEPMSRFLLQAAVFEAVVGSRQAVSGVGLSLEQLESVLAPLRRLPWGAWRWPTDPSWFYAGDRLLAFVNQTGAGREGPADRYAVALAGRQQDDLRYLARLGGIEWEAGPDWLFEVRKGD